MGNIGKCSTEVTPVHASYDCGITTNLGLLMAVVLKCISWEPNELQTSKHGLALVEG